jgi:hypothetical protein
VPTLNTVSAPHDCSDQPEHERAHLSDLKNGIMKTKQAIRKKTLPNIAQKLPMLAMQKPAAEITNNIQPTKLI